jgi:hypothetical protein
MPRPALSFEVRGAEGRLVKAPEVLSVVLPERLRRLGRCREVGSSGEERSVLTTILGAWGALDLRGGG